MARGETQPLMSSFGHQTACELLGLPGDGAGTGYRDLLLAELARASEKRAQVIALAMVLGAAEHGVRDVHTWQSAEGSYWASYGVPLAARYLAWLAEHTDYTLSGIEAEVAAYATGADQPDNDGEPGQTDSEPEPERRPGTDPGIDRNQLSPRGRARPAFPGGHCREQCTSGAGNAPRKGRRGRAAAGEQLVTFIKFRYVSYSHMRRKQIESEEQEEWQGRTP